MGIISFPGLGLVLNINPVAFPIAFSLFGRNFNWDIHWYGIIIALGFLLAVILGNVEARRTGFGDENLSDFLIWVTPAAIIGARLYYVLFKLDYYSQHPGEIIAIWQGGIAIYGAVIAAVITAILYCRAKKLNLWLLFDIGSLGLLIGQSIGRWGNFVNQEAFGGNTTLPWGMTGDKIKEYLMDLKDPNINPDLPVHPTFLYESLWNIIGFIILFSIRKKKPFNGFLFWCYLTWYGLGRIWIEGLRTDSLMWGSARISQLVAAVCIVVGITAIIIGFKRAKEAAMDTSYTSILEGAIPEDEAGINAVGEADQEPEEVQKDVETNNEDNDK